MKSYSTVELAKALGVGRDSLYRWMRQGLIPAGRVVTMPIANLEVRVWSPADVAKVRTWMRQNPHGGRGKPKRRTR